MKTTQQFDSLLGRLEADVEARIRSLFVRCPSLHGFAVQDRAMLPKDVDPNRIPDADLFVTDIGIFPKIDSQYDEIHDEITYAISDLVQDQPHAFDYLRGRTFARSLH
ncbi:MAG TPA: hypothetical protein VNZ59_14170 [Burkholderiales bacterium]|nr:hypothetical protein [Burkholderiales bacterium]